MHPLAGLFMLISGGSGFPPPVLSNQTTTDLTIDPTNSDLTVFTDNDGDFRGNGNLISFNPAGEWLADKPGDAAEYEVRLTVSSGVSPNSGSAVGSWLNLGTNRSWTRTRSTVGVDDGVWLIEIGFEGTSSAIDSSSVTIQCNVDVI